MPGDGWRGEYFNNRMLGGAAVLERTDPEIRFDWGEGSPDPQINADNFSVRWARDLELPAGAYRFTLRVYGGVRFYVDGRLLINQWHDADARLYQADCPLAAGPHALRLEYYDYTGPAAVELGWQAMAG